MNKLVKSVKKNWLADFIWVVCGISAGLTLKLIVEGLSKLF